MFIFYLNFKKNGMKKHLIFFSLAALLLSCRVTPYLYHPVMLNMPLPHEEKEIKATIYTGSEGAGIQASYSINNWLVLAGNCSMVYDGKYIDHAVTDIGAGFYKKIGKTGSFEILGSGGYGFTNTNVLNKRWLDYADNEYLNIYSKMYRGSLQLDIGVRNDYIEFSIGARLTDMFFDGDYEALYYDINNHIDSLKHMPLKGHALFIEPGMTLSAGIRNVKFTGSIGFSYQIDGMTINPFYGPLYFPLYATAGITVELFGKKNNKTLNQKN
jgi:hypothetical protein